MGYNDYNPKKEAGIAAQVAFKGAVEYAIANSLDLSSTEGDATFGLVFGALNAHLTDALKANTAAAGPTTVADNEAAVRGAFAGTTTEGNDNSRERVVDGITVKGGDGSEVPAWLVAAAKEAGVTSVWDNRIEAVGTKKPLFKAADGTKNQKGFPVGFWPAD